MTKGSDDSERLNTEPNNEGPVYATVRKNRESGDDSNYRNREGLSEQNNQAGVKRKEEQYQENRFAGHTYEKVPAADEPLYETIGPVSNSQKKSTNPYNKLVGGEDDPRYALIDATPEPENIYDTPKGPENSSPANWHDRKGRFGIKGLAGESSTDSLDDNKSFLRRVFNNIVNLFFWKKDQKDSGITTLGQNPFSVDSRLNPVYQPNDPVYDKPQDAVNELYDEPQAAKEGPIYDMPKGPGPGSKKHNEKPPEEPIYEEIYDMPKGPKKEQKAKEPVYESIDEVREAIRSAALAVSEVAGYSQPRPPRNMSANEKVTEESIYSLPSNIPASASKNQARHGDANGRGGRGQ